MPRSSSIRKPISNTMVDREFDPDHQYWRHEEWTDEDEAALEEWEETRRQKIAEANEY